MSTARTERFSGGQTATDGSSATLLRVTNIAKAFGATQAVRDASFELRAGEVLALVGENGCGKSTMVKILSGVHLPDAGEIELDGEVVGPLSTPKQAQRRGIVTVFQEVLVAESCSVLDNVWLGTDDMWRTRVPPRVKRARAREVLGELLGREVDLGMAVEELSLSDRQACGIVRALLRDPRILILDEATSALDVATRDRLFAMVGALSRQGVGVIFITHRMDEIEQIGDWITVMRSGETVGDLTRGHWTHQQLVQLMTGADALGSSEQERLEPVAERRGDVVLSVRGLRLRPDGQPIDLEVRAGELIGLAGLEGHGGNTFLEALRGGVVTEGEVVRHHRRRRGRHQLSGRRGRPRHRLRAARAPPGRRVQLDVDPRELRAADAGPRRALRRAADGGRRGGASPPTSTASASSSAPRMTRSRPSRAATSRR